MSIKEYIENLFAKMEDGEYNPHFDTIAYLNKMLEMLKAEEKNDS